MVINFNLLLVWLPMCKYTLTRLAVLANHSVRRQEALLGQLLAGPSPTSSKPPECPIKSALERSRLAGDLSDKQAPVGRAARMVAKLKQSFGEAIRRARYAFCSRKIKFTSNFLIVVDHCTSLHTICATTITIASVIHTAAHLMNVINFSKKFDSLLGDLNMAEYRGQNPLQLIVSVPGLTGCCMLLILFLMSLSSISIIRNSSYDLFQIFHRLSVLFVLLLILHPSSHVLKEQSNVARHQPDLCYDKMQQLSEQQSSALSGPDGTMKARAAVEKSGEYVEGASMKSAALQLDASGSIPRSNDRTRESGTLLHLETGSAIDKLSERGAHTQSRHNGTGKWADFDDRSERGMEDQVLEGSNGVVRKGVEDSALLDELCVDSRPTFVAQSSICWYVLGAGLSCYLLDLFLRRLRRSRSPIRLMDARTDAEGNLIELVLSNNHKRFVHWLPGQFVYLNCPQIATYEWHPFTISSMDNDRRQFTLHIKTGGDWTRKLRYELELRQSRQKLQRRASESQARDKENSMSLSCQRQRESLHTCCCCSSLTLKTIPGFARMSCFQSDSHQTGHTLAGQPDYSKLVNVVANIEDFDHTTGQLEVESKRVVGLAHADNWQTAHATQSHESSEYANGCLKIDLNYLQASPQLHSMISPAKVLHGAALLDTTSLDLFIDGPFHSPFERLLGQQVSVCIASGVGWTAFSSIFQQITNNIIRCHPLNDSWWWRWRQFQPARPNAIAHPDGAILQRASSPMAKLHLVVIVTSIEQFKPFYRIVKRYFEQSKGLYQSGQTDAKLKDPVQEVTAFITRSSPHDSDVVEFCRKENLSLANERTSYHSDGSDVCPRALRINQVFLVHFGRPNLSSYLSSFKTLYADERKISVYCCGPHQVKQTVKEVCKKLDKDQNSHRLLPNFRYHEENF